MNGRCVNASISNIINRLNFVQAFPQAVADLTGFTGKIDLDLAAGYSDVERLNAALMKYGLKFEKQLMEQEIFGDQKTGYSAIVAGKRMQLLLLTGRIN